MSDSNPSISVVVPCLNAAPTLRASLESVLDQQYTDFEVIWFDDGSTDGSAEIVEGYAKRDERIRLIRSEHVGIVEALRLGCEAAGGRYIARMDADDVADKQRFAKQMAYLEANPDVGLCGTGVRTLGADAGSGRLRYEAWLNGLVSHEDIVRELFVECPIAHPTMMIRREALHAAGGYQEHGWPEDYDLVMRCHKAGVRMGKVAERLLDWRDGAERLSMRDARYSPDNFRRLKRHHLPMVLPGDGRPLYQWGAGEVGKKWLIEWDDVRPVAVVDINPRKFGKVIHGVEVITPERLPGPGDGFTVVAVGAPGAREEIREWFGERGYREQTDYLFLA